MNELKARVENYEIEYNNNTSGTRTNGIEYG